MASSAGKRVVALAIDPSEFSEYAFDWYVNYLHHEGTNMLGIHIPDATFDLNKFQKEVSKGHVKESLERQYSKITELEEKYQKKMHAAKIKGTVLSVPSKTPGQTIIDTAKEEKCFCIVMGTRGRSLIKKAILGSVSDHVVKNADMPVIVVKKPGHQ